MVWVVNSDAPGALPRKRTGTHCIGSCVGLRVDLDRCGKFPPPYRDSIPDRPARTESLYRLSYLGRKSFSGVPTIYRSSVGRSVGADLHYAVCSLRLPYP